MLLDPPVLKRRASLAAVGTLAVAVVAFTSALPGSGRRPSSSAAEVQTIADDLARTTGFRVTVDESVVDEVNRVVSQPENRANFRAGIERLRAYRSIGGRR